LNIALSLVFGVLTAMGFGTADFAAKLSTNRIGFLRTAFFVQLIGSFFVLPFALPDAYRVFLNPWVTLAAVLLGVVNIMGTLFLYKGFEVGRLSIVSPIASTGPVVAILLAVTFLGEIVTRQLLFGICLVMLGIILVSLQTRQEDGSKQLASGTAYAIGFMLFGGLLLFGLKPVTTVLGPFLPVLIMRLVGIPVLAVPALAAQRRSHSPVFRLVLPVAFFDTFANVAYTLGVSLGMVTIVAPLGGMFSSVTILLAWAFLGERPSRHQIVGFAAILIGVATLGAFG